MGQVQRRPVELIKMLRGDFPLPAEILLDQVTVGAAGVASITLSTNSQSLSDLRVVWSLRGAKVATWEYVYNTINAIAANYEEQAVYGQAAVAGASESLGAARWSAIITSANSPASLFGQGELYIFDYANSNKKTTMRTMYGAALGTASGNLRDIVVHGFVNTAQAVTSVTLTPESGTFVQYSKAKLYGIR